MKSTIVIAALTLSTIPALTSVRAEEQVALEEPQQPDLVKELLDQPDGVLRVKANEDGSFKSLVVKASVEIEDVLGAQKGKQMARKEAEIKCKQALAKWLNEYCIFTEAANKTTAIVTKGESAKDAAGNVVKLREQKGTEIKVSSETSASYANAVLRGLIVLASEVTKEPEYVLLMGLSQETISQAGSLAKALATRVQPAADDKPAAEKKVNPAASGF